MSSGTEGTFPWIETAAVVIAAAAWFLAVYEARQTRRHNRLSVKPWLTFTRCVTPMDASSGTPGIYLLNNGIGPATITRFQLSVCGRPVGGDPYEQWREVVKAAGLEGLDASCNAIDPPTGIGASEQRALIQVLEPSEPGERRRWLEGLCSIGCAVEYESFYGESFTSNLDCVDPDSLESAAQEHLAPAGGRQERP